jgi:hypothetical protein
MNNYRITFLHSLPVDYWNKKKGKELNFKQLHKKYYPLIKQIKEIALDNNIDYIWHFYEPFIEITWYGSSKNSNEFIKDLKIFLLDNSITDYKIYTPKDGEFADWFCCNDKEKEFGGLRHAWCSQFVELIDKYEKDIEKGKGVNEQIKRTIHCVCNPLGLNYTEEAKICFSRGLICLLFKYFNHKKAVWIYTKIFKQKY